MKRLTRKSDYYNEYESNNSEENQKQILMNCAQDPCQHFGINPSTIEVEVGRDTYVNFGNIEEDGFEVGIQIYPDNKVNRIILSAGKNSKGKSIYVETREQDILDSFLNQSQAFIDWMDTAIADIELRF